MPSTTQQAPSALTQVSRLLVFLFPALIATTPAGSYIYGVLLLLSLVFGRGWSSLDHSERTVMIGLVAVFAVMSLSLVNTEELLEGGKFLERYLRLALIVPIYLMFRRYSYSFGRELILGAMMSGVFMALQGYYQITVQEQHVATGNYHKIIFGDLAVLWASYIVLFSVVVARARWHLLLLVLAVAALLYASVLSQARGSWLYIPIFISILLWSEWTRIRDNLKRVIPIALILLIGMVLLVAKSGRIMSPIENGVADFTAFFDDPGVGYSLVTRMNLWRNSLLLAKDAPLLGIGLGDFHNEMTKMVADGRSWSQYVARYGHAHSIYFDSLANAGIVGLLATLMGFLVLPLRVFVAGARRATEPWARFYSIGGVVLVMAYATFGLSEGIWVRNPFVNTYALLLVVMLAGMKSAGETNGDAMVK